MNTLMKRTLGLLGVALLAAVVFAFPAQAAGVYADRVTDIQSGPAHAFPQDLVVYNGKLYFSANHPDDGYELLCQPS